MHKTLIALFGALALLSHTIRGQTQLQLQQGFP